MPKTICFHIICSFIMRGAERLRNVICVNMLLQWRIATGLHQTLNAPFNTTDTDKGVTSFSLSCIFAGSWDSWTSQQSSPAPSVQESVINFIFHYETEKKLLNIKFCCLTFKFYVTRVQYMQIPLITLKDVLYFWYFFNFFLFVFLKCPYFYWS